MRLLRILLCSIAGSMPVVLPAMERVLVAEDGSGFVLSESGERFRPWGVNYDHDADGRLIEDYWHGEWATVAADFGEIKALGANVVRVHLQLGKFMKNAEKPAQRELARLGDLLKLAERTGLYLDLTGLGCYHKADVPGWYDALDESERWKVQARFWSAIAKCCADSPAVFCYDLMNEPVLPGKDGESEWLLGELAGKFFVQRIALNQAGRDRKAIAKAWIESLVDAIRTEDQHHLITVGVIPWAMVWPKAKPIFHDPEVGRRLDFVSVHFYPEGDIDKALAALKVYDLGKPVVVEEFFPLKCSGEQMEKFLGGAGDIADGWMSFYWGKPAAEYPKDELKGALIADWLRRFEERSPRMTGSN
ncbi:MAG: cellulase family glycosylhydrolase [Verrucomicrobiales bacterium]